jgi:uncharacterized protein (TIGR01777 family)
MKIIVAGGTGMIGSALIQRLIQFDYQVVLLTRKSASSLNPFTSNVTVESWSSGKELAKIVNGSEAVVNLSGESIGSKRWTPRQKERILASRIEATRTMVEAIETSHTPPPVLLNASAVGYYGNVPDDEVTESTNCGSGFLAEVCSRWEAEAGKVTNHHVRSVLLRTGIVLDKRSGALQKLLLPFKAFIGGRLGSGRQWFPWIHLEDEVSAILHAINHQEVTGPLNLAAPHSVTMSQFCTTLGKALHRPSWIPVPSIALKSLLGAEMAEELILGGQKVIPKKLLDSGFKFRYPTVETALAEIFG